MLIVTSLAITLAFLAALLRGGKVSALGTLRFRGLHFLAAAAIMRLLLKVPLLQAGLVEPVAGGLQYGGVLYTLSFVMTLLALVSNFDLPGLKVMALGMFSNLLVIAANLGHMPGAADKLPFAGYKPPLPGHWSNPSVMGDGTPLWFLGDQFLAPHPWPLSFLISPGDVLVIVGLFWFFQKVMKQQ